MIARVREVENTYRALKNEMDEQILDEKRKQKNTIYADIE